jgi:hypothetical protein
MAPVALTISLKLEQRGQLSVRAEYSDVFRDNELYRHTGNERRHSPFVFECAAKRCASEPSWKLRKHSARQEHAAAPNVGQGDVAGISAK